jgi:hypothetical protein
LTAFVVFLAFFFSHKTAQNKVEQLQQQARVNETLRKLSTKTPLPNDEKGKMETPGSNKNSSSSSSNISSSSDGDGPPPPYHQAEEIRYMSDEDDPELRRAIALSLGQDW